MGMSSIVVVDVIHSSHLFLEASNGVNSSIHVRTNRITIRFRLWLTRLLYFVSSLIQDVYDGEDGLRLT
ncbi:unnamed protein product [Haemonchus placei]|uniref:Secreted protein n=1 Tax=Haemonchus placei TaxID=6290 RepID=A0A0N4VYB3_HAEPC|nr:unnamed protein product [Haemonchus placei]